MKKLQLFIMITLLTVITYHNQSYAWSWSSDGGSSQTIVTRNGVTTVNGVVVSSGGSGNVQVITRNGVTWVNGKRVDSSNTNDSIQEAGELETQEVDISDVRIIKGSGFGSLTVEQCISCPETLTITADKNIMPHIKRIIYGRQLDLGIKDNINFSTTPTIDFHAVVQDINKISIAGSLNMQSEGDIKTQKLNINKSGEGNMEASVNVENLTVNKSGSGDLELSGEANEQNIKQSGSGVYEAYTLTSQDASIKQSGSGDAYVNVQNILSYHKTGSGTLYYTGNPKISGSKKGSKGLLINLQIK